MKTLSMIQPWASLFMLGAINHETRSWKTKYRGPIAIHSSQKLDKHACRLTHVESLLQKYGYTQDTLPLGAVIGVCELENCLRIIENNNSSAVLEDGEMISGIEYLLGDYKIGGFVWKVKGKRLLKTPLPAKGQLGLWNCNIENYPK
ncbi:2-oxoglutarate dehydrogenase E1 [Bacillus luteolus]|uniref:2-oxoglutarate dehydrogenase E1 n=1 Tax=Litchfieldia luteola TaxID=682179 RepID=A0ABR9QDR9_9BACI|nr:2-oxoglutarate dehydrogenase E1 [Cytobacillus luteolus]